MKINKTYHIITIGCQMNIADSERLAAFLESRGFLAAPDWRKAKVVILNTCGIRQMAEDRVYGLVNQIKKLNPGAQVVITGCLSRRIDVQKRLAKSAALFLPINEMLQLPELLDGRELNPYYSLDAVRLKEGEKYLNIPSKHVSDVSAYVPIGNGCNNFCSYCVVPYARGREVYRPAAEIIAEVRGLIKAGYKEIILIAQNVNSYKDDKYDFPRLLRQLAKLPGKFWLRFSSSHPKDMSDELIRIIGESRKICPHLHLAVQSGDDKILAAMNRKYTAASYKKLIKKVRAARPGIAITTDVIVGFPGETKAQFLNTVKLFKEVNFDLAYIAQYSPRPGTASAKMKDNVSPAEKKRRANAVNEILKQTAGQNNQKYLGKSVEVLVEGQNKRGKYYGKTGAYNTVLINVPAAFKIKDGLIGQFVKVKIDQALPFGLEGVLEKKKDRINNYPIL
ncbi:MAG: tRNA (N6-isopentenyl adenosine(37)-C2)-methylthiotransferase MiaB [Patescibacteria group bacterium]